MIKKASKKMLGWAATSHLLHSPRQMIKKAIFQFIENRKGAFFFFNDLFKLRSFYNPETHMIRALYKQIQGETMMLLREVEAYQLYMSIKQTSKIEGDIAEVGVFKGGSAKLLSEAKSSKKLHLFDTFEGLPSLSQNDNKNQFHEKQFASSYDEVRDYLKNYEEVYFYKGLFPSTAGPISNLHFSFVHLDVDLYEATLDCLKFFYPRMSRGGIIISHDYGYALGVRKAFNEFFSDKPEPIIELEMSGTQCLVVKT